MKNKFLNLTLVLLFITCGGSSTPVDSKDPNSSAKKVEPKRITIDKGSVNSIEYFDLEIGESKQFVIQADKGKSLTIGNGGDIQITMITKGKMKEESNDPTSYNGITTSSGDFIFEVKNTAKQKIQSSVNVFVENSVY
jgi:hypothetical protein